MYAGVGPARTHDLDGEPTDQGQHPLEGVGDRWHDGVPGKAVVRTAVVRDDETYSAERGTHGSHSAGKQRRRKRPLGARSGAQRFGIAVMTRRASLGPLGYQTSSIRAIGALSP